MTALIVAMPTVGGTGWAWLWGCTLVAVMAVVAGNIPPAARRLLTATGIAVGLASVFCAPIYLYCDGIYSCFMGYLASWGLI